MSVCLTSIDYRPVSTISKRIKRSSVFIQLCISCCSFFLIIIIYIDVNPISPDLADYQTVLKSNCVLRRRSSARASFHYLFSACVLYDWSWAKNSSWRHAFLTPCMHRRLKQTGSQLDPSDIWRVIQNVQLYMDARAKTLINAKKYHW